MQVLLIGFEVKHFEFNYAVTRIFVWICTAGLMSCLLTLPIPNNGTFCLQIVNNAPPRPSGNASRYIPAPISTHNNSHISLCFRNTNILSSTLCFCLCFLHPQPFSHFLIERVTFSQSVAMIWQNNMYLFTWIYIELGFSYFYLHFCFVAGKIAASKIHLWVPETVVVIREDVFKIKRFVIEVYYPYDLNYWNYSLIFFFF